MCCCSFSPTIFAEDLKSAVSIDISRVYSISRPYILLPNQFWVHKNHLTVLSALARLPSTVRPLIVATGSTVDYRRPDYFGLLENRVNCLDLSANFLILGLVPRSHFLALMSSASAYLNPSYSEGWNTSVEEAKLFSLPLLLSDIPVHREQSDSNTLFFHPSDCNALSILLQGFGDAATAMV